ncbi:MAG: ClpP family protease, partial [Acidimicrobiia bacterium]
EFVAQRALMAELLARHTGQPLDRIEQDIDRDFILRGKEAVGYGLVDDVLDRPGLAAVAPSPNGKGGA